MEVDGSRSLHEPIAGWVRHEHLDKDIRREDRHAHRHGFQNRSQLASTAAARRPPCQWYRRSEIARGCSEYADGCERIPAPPPSKQKAARGQRGRFGLDHLELVDAEYTCEAQDVERRSEQCPPTLDPDVTRENGRNCCSRDKAEKAERMEGELRR